jgi:aminopeptidase N
LRRLATTGRAGDAEIDAELSRDPTDDGRRNALACRAAIGDAWHKEAAWDLLVGGDGAGYQREAGYQTAGAVAAGFNQPEHAAVLAPYAQRYFDALPRLWQTRSHQSRRVLGEALFPYPAASAALIAQIDDFLAAPDRTPGLVRLLIERRDIVQRALKSRALP